MQLQLRIVHRIQSAVKSITSCTAPVVRAGWVEVKAFRLNSPCVRRRTVEYREVRFPFGALYARSGNHALLINATEPERLVPAFPLNGLVTEWEGGLVPVSLVQPVYDLAARLGLRPEEPRGELVLVYVLVHTLAGWHFGRPVFWAAEDWDVNTPVRLDGEPTYQQGNLLVGWSKGVVYAPLWYPSQSFYNHLLVNDEEDAAVTPADVVAVLYEGRPHAAVRFGGGRIVARDHEDLVVPEGDWVVLHPFPNEEDRVD